MWFISQVQYLHSMEIIDESKKATRPSVTLCEIDGGYCVFTSGSSLEQVRDVIMQWTALIENSRDLTHQCLEGELSPGAVFSSAVDKRFNDDRDAVGKFLTKTQPNSLTELLDDLLLYRIEFIKQRKSLIAKAHETNANYIEIAPLSEGRLQCFKEEAHSYNAVSYEASKIKSVYLHLLIQMVFQHIENPTQLHPKIKQKIRVQPSLLQYLQTGDNMPWALDFTLGISVQGLAPYHAIPDYSLIRDYFEKSATRELPHWSGMVKLELTNINMTPFDAGTSVTHELPYPDFLKCMITPSMIENPKSKIEMGPKTLSPQESLKKDTVMHKHSDSNSLKKPFVPAVLDKPAYYEHEDYTVSIKHPNLKLNDTKKQGRFIQHSSPVLVMPPESKTKSIFSKVNWWLENKLFNYQIRTIDGHDWESTLKQIPGVTIRDTSGSSHFEVLLDDRVIGGYFRANEYTIAYKKWLQKIITKLGYNPS